jgi:hypothetical protein
MSMHTMTRPAAVASLLEPGDGSLASDARRFGVGLCLSAIYGLALGSRLGWLAMAAHAVGVPMALAAVSFVGTPAFYVGLAHAGFDVDTRSLRSAVTHGTATAGMVLAGFAPVLALLALTCESPLSVAAHAAIGLAIGGLLGLRALYQELARLASSKSAPRAGLRAIQVAFALFAAVLAARVWWVSLPMFGGGAP